MTAGERALDFIEDGQIVGLGTGRAANAFTAALGKRVRAGLRVKGVPTSERTAELAAELGIPLLTLAEAGTLDVCIDGADEVDPNLDLIKGWGGALVREKIVAASAKKLIVVVGAEKKVERLGARGKLPVEIVPFGLPLCERRLRALGLLPVLRQSGDGGGKPYVTDNANLILDCGLAPLDDARALEEALLSIPGVVGTGLFVGMADAVVIEDEARSDEQRVEVRVRGQGQGHGRTP